MHRLAPVLLLGGVLLFANGVHAPASPAPVVDGSAGVTASVGQASAVMGEVSAELDRLKARVSPPPAAPVPQRDPFRFGRRVEPAIAAPVDVAPPPEPVVELPRLVAVVETPGDAGVVVRSVSLAIGSDVHIVKVGDVIGQFTVQGIDAGSVRLQDRATATVYRIPLR